MIKCNQLQLITITNYDDPMSANQHQQLPVGPVYYCFPAIYRVDTCFCFDICKRFLNFPLPTCFYLRNPLFYIISWIIYYLKSCIIFLNFISFQWFCQFYFIWICFLWSDHAICKSFHMYHLSQFVTIVIKTNFKNNKHLILFELLLFLYNVLFIHIDVGWSQA